MIRPTFPGKTIAFLPTREITLLIDPHAVPALLSSLYVPALQLVHDLRGVEPSIVVHLLVTPDIMEPRMIPRSSRFASLFAEVADGAPPPFCLSDGIPPGLREPLVADNDGSNHIIALLAIADVIQADGIVTARQILIDARYALYQHHRIRVIPLTDFGDVLEIFAHGHSVFWSAASPERYITGDQFYPLMHWKNRRYARWFNDVAAKIKNENLAECLRSALLNRYPFMLYARDMIRFYEIQMDFYSRRRLKRRFSMGVGFHVTTFYLLLWGMLDHLTIMAKWAFDLKIDERKCGIRSRTFWRELDRKDPRLGILLTSPDMNQWLSMMADMRHAAAHRSLALPTVLLVDTEESRKSDEEIRDILKREHSEMYKWLPSEILESMEPTMIGLWRIEKMKTVAPSMVYIKGEKETYLWDPVVSLDHDLQYLTAVMDAFLIVLFGKPDEPAR